LGETGEIVDSSGDAAAASAAQERFDAARFGLAIAAGLGAAVAGAAIWAIVTVQTNYELGIMAIAVGFVVGKAVSAAANSRNTAYGVLGAVCSLLGCVLGNLLSVVGFYANAKHIGYFDALGMVNPAVAVRLMTVTFHPMDLIFYAIGIYEGYRFSIVR
jgi:FtsH-binding integral membrane protein